MSKPILTGNEKIVVSQGKGGVGKSTYASQVVAAFLFAHNGGQKVRYIEVDDANKSANLYENSEVITGEKIPVSKDLDLSLAMQGTGNIVIDLGGNKTSELVIKNIGENEDFENVSWIIPLDTSKDAAQNALKTYFQIVSIYEDSDLEPKILFVLNGSNNISEKEEEDLKLEFAYFFGSKWMKLDFTLINYLSDEHKNNFVFFDKFEKILMSTALQKLAVEIGTDAYKQEAKENKSVANSEFIDIEQKYNAGEATKEELEACEAERIKAFDVFRSTRSIQSFVKESIEPQYKKLKELVLN